MGRRPVIPDALTKGPFTLRQAIWAGLSPRQLRNPAWRRLGPSSYILATLPASPEHELQSIAWRLPPGAAFSGMTAAWIHGIDVPHTPIEVTLPDAHGRGALVGASVRRGALSEQEIVTRRGLRVTAPARTVADLARSLPLEEGVVILDAFLKQRLIRLNELPALAAAGLRWGAGRLRRAIELSEPLSESPMETRLRLRLVLNGLPRPEAQVRLYDAKGGFLARADLFYREARLAIEYDGETHRNSLAADNRRHNALLIAGYRTLRFTGSDVFGNQGAMVDQVRFALNMSRRHSRRPPELPR